MNKVARRAAKHARHHIQNGKHCHEDVQEKPGLPDFGYVGERKRFCAARWENRFTMSGNMPRRSGEKNGRTEC